MNDPESLLQQLTPRGPDADVAARIRSVMARELSSPARPTWESRLGWLTAAAILLGIGGNYLVLHADRQQQARILAFPGPPGTADLARLVESVSDVETGRWLQAQFHLAEQRRCRPVTSSTAFERNISILMRETDHEPIPENFQTPGARPGNPARPGAARQWTSDLANRPRAGGTAEHSSGRRGSLVIA